MLENNDVRPHRPSPLVQGPEGHPDDLLALPLTQSLRRDRQQTNISPLTPVCSLTSGFGHPDQGDRGRKGRLGSGPGWVHQWERSVVSVEGESARSSFPGGIKDRRRKVPGRSLIRPDPGTRGRGDQDPMSPRVVQGGGTTRPRNPKVTRVSPQSTAGGEGRTPSHPRPGAGGPVHHSQT